MKPVIGHIEKFLHVDYQNGEVMVWAIVNDELPKREFTIICSGTGWPIADFQNALSYIGTIESYEGYIWHYFAVEVAKINASREGIQASFEGALEEMEPIEIDEEEEEFYFDDDDDEELPEEDLANFLCRMLMRTQEAVN